VLCDSLLPKRDKTLATAEIVNKASVASAVVVTLEIEFRTTVESLLPLQNKHGPGFIEPNGQRKRVSQRVHVIEPVLFVYEPTSQREQLTPNPADDEYDPAGQGKQEEGPDATDPAGHGLHSDCACSDIYPTGQGIHIVLLTFDIVPAEQASHVDCCVFMYPA
jgi:hypothetical protein